MGKRAKPVPKDETPEANPAESANWPLVGCVFCISAAVSFGIYFQTLFPSVPGGDAGEMITIAYQVVPPLLRVS